MKNPFVGGTDIQYMLLYSMFFPSLLFLFSWTAEGFSPQSSKLFKFASAPRCLSQTAFPSRFQIPSRSQLQLQSLLDPAILPSFNEALMFNIPQAIILCLIPQKSLTPSGLFHATILGIGLWTFLGVQGWFLCVFYLIAGSLVTKIGFKQKERLGIAEKRGGARGPENVWGSAGTGMICALLTYFFPTWSSALKVGYVASLSTKLADTFQSEVVFYHLLLGCLIDECHIIN
jgi:hypothetical protein